MMYTGEEARTICFDILASYDEKSCKYPLHEGDCGYFKNEIGSWSAFDNQSGDCWCEDFKTKKQAKEWCEGKIEVLGS